MADLTDMNNRFNYHAPSNIKADRHIAVRINLKQVAIQLVNLTPASREQSLMLTKLEEAMFWANAAIARNEYAESSTPETKQRNS